MTFDLGAILVGCIAALVNAVFVPARARSWALLAGSAVAVFWLQPALPIRFSDFILPAATLALAVAGWTLTRPPGAAVSHEDRVTLGVLAAVVIGLSLMRFVGADYRLTASRPPDPLHVTIVLAVGGVLFAALARLARRASLRFVTMLGILAVVALFALFKTDALAAEASRIWRGLTEQDASLAKRADLNWLGFSYVAFRLIHTLRDRLAGLLPALSLREFVTYVIFFPAFTAGPIDRAERFVADLRGVPSMRGLDAARLGAARFESGFVRIGLGLFKKFVVADSLALFALDAVNAAQATSPAGLWALLLAYSLRLYFDFAGYTDIAIGLGVLFGIQLPENFERPYLRTSLTSFWQSWHVTLSSWARFYVFTPLSRWFLTRERRPSAVVIVLLAQWATMTVIGLWHGVTLNFAAWGAWHGLGLFVHKQWSDRTRTWYRSLEERPGHKRAWTVCAWLVTFLYVVLGWVWFALPDVGQSAQVLGRLFGIGWR